MVNFLDLLNGLENRQDAQSVAKADEQAGKTQPHVSPVDKAYDRMTMQRHISARKAELQAKRVLAKHGKREAAQTLPSSEGSTKNRQQDPDQQPDRTAESSSSDRNEWMEGFDIRRAVVWSEILRPKFKEDEGSDRFGIPY